MFGGRFSEANMLKNYREVDGVLGRRNRKIVDGRHGASRQERLAEWAEGVSSPCFTLLTIASGTSR